MIPKLNINPRYPLVKLADTIDWGHIHTLCSPFLSESEYFAVQTRLIAGLLYLQHEFDLSDEDTVQGWIDNPHWQVFTGEEYLQTRSRVEPLSLAGWRKGLGESGLEALFSAIQDTVEKSGFQLSEFGWNKYLRMGNIDKELLFYNPDFSKARQVKLFKKYVEEIGFETGNFCNRSCSYCPLSVYSRGKQETMADELFDKIVSELGYLEYDKIINLNLYNEPLSDKKLVDKIKKIRDKVPNARINFNSNGDYLTRKILDQLADAGLNSIYVSMQLGKNESYSDDIQKEKIKNFLKKLDLKCEINYFIPSKKIEADVNYKGLQLLVMSNNWAVYGNDRGGVLSHLSENNRFEPCMRPIREFQFDFKGNVYLCCQIYPNDPKAGISIIGNLNQNSMAEIYASEKATNFRKHLYPFSEKYFPCNSCKDASFAEESTAVLRDEIINRLKNMNS